jgi:hypothetical protein
VWSLVYKGAELVANVCGWVELVAKVYGRAGLVCMLLVIGALSSLSFTYSAEKGKGLVVMISLNYCIILCTLNFCHVFTNHIE